MGSACVTDQDRGGGPNAESFTDEYALRLLARLLARAYLADRPVDPGAPPSQPPTISALVSE
jgi:hypothetical protein